MKRLMFLPTLALSILLTNGLWTQNTSHLIHDKTWWIKKVSEGEMWETYPTQSLINT